MAQEWCVAYGVLDNENAKKIDKIICARKGLKPSVEPKRSTSSTSSTTVGASVTVKSTAKKISVVRKKSFKDDDSIVDTGSKLFYPIIYFFYLFNIYSFINYIFICAFQFIHSFIIFNLYYFFANYFFIYFVIIFHLLLFLFFIFIFCFCHRNGRIFCLGGQGNFRILMIKIVQKTLFFTVKITEINIEKRFYDTKRNS